MTEQEFVTKYQARIDALPMSVSGRDFMQYALYARVLSTLAHTQGLDTRERVLVAIEDIKNYGEDELARMKKHKVAYNGWSAAQSRVWFHIQAREVETDLITVETGVDNDH